MAGHFGRRVGVVTTGRGKRQIEALVSVVADLDRAELSLTVESTRDGEGTVDGVFVGYRGEGGSSRLAGRWQELGRGKVFRGY